jgi:hypothetical protein
VIRVVDPVSTPGAEECGELGQQCCSKPDTNKCAALETECVDGICVRGPEPVSSEEASASNPAPVEGGVAPDEPKEALTRPKDPKSNERGTSPSNPRSVPKPKPSPSQLSCGKEGIKCCPGASIDFTARACETDNLECNSQQICVKLECGKLGKLCCKEDPETSKRACEVGEGDCKDSICTKPLDPPPPESCGQEREKCCLSPDAACSNSQLECKDEICTQSQCGRNNQACCPDGSCIQETPPATSLWGCNDGRCQPVFIGRPCGLGQPCCVPRGNCDAGECNQVTFVCEDKPPPGAGCGADGEKCCTAPNPECAERTLVCSAGTCKKLECGVLDQPCCTEEPRCGRDSIADVGCILGKCKPNFVESCKVGEQCCGTDDNNFCQNGAVCNTSTFKCEKATSQRCGHVGEPCCKEGMRCKAPLKCSAEKCQKPLEACGGRGQRCCRGRKCSVGLKCNWAQKCVQRSPSKPGPGFKSRY